MTNTEKSESPLEIVQDYEVDFDGELGSPIPVFWSYGWHKNAREFIDEMLTFCLDNEIDIPPITGDDALQHLWQYNRETGEGIIFDRAAEPNSETGWPRRSDWKKVTVLDLYAPRRGARKCVILNCKEPWAVGLPVRAMLSARAEDDPNLTVELYLCRPHSKLVPEPSYRVFMVPVGATVVMPSPEEPAVKPIDLPGAEGSNTGHGHVYPRPDGQRARCGGPSICKDCARDLARKESEK